MDSAATIVAVGAGFLLGGMVKGAIGLGMPVVVLAILAPMIGLKATLAVLVFPAVAANIWQALAGPMLRDLVARLWPFLGAAVAGIWLGVSVLAEADTDMLEALLGAMLATYSAFALLTPQLPPPGRREVWLSPLAGGTGGLMFGMTGIFIVPGILYLQTLGLGRDAFVQALGLTFLTIGATMGLAMGSHDLLSPEQAAVSAAAILPAFAGMWIGQRVRHRISESLFRRVFFVALLVVGVYMIARILG
ncbi:sulfite exporter TauE/SafE family protein [Limibaculum sp. FT325]|uniref:sulfite exporter TauE/SafE family protein n=1 Tax=Thermohalobaculum sediminis TaxID=2939436 RepID=UPI0020BF65D0|nr:sulfite exporter TauE/SafE family protein [Limibaculum sediminis]MCL5776974.1 sulfite exporter TauE/SafE family protein [Limibaculum sediminis]